MTEVTIDELYSEESEADILGIMMIDEEKVSRILTTLNQQDFCRAENRLIFKAIETLYKQHKPTDIVSVSELLKFNNELDRVGGRSRVNDLALGVSITSNWEQLCKVIVKYSKKRQLMSICRQSLSELAESTDVDEVAQKLSSTSQDILTRTGITKFQGLTQGIIQMMDNVDRLVTNGTGTLGLPTGFSELDFLLSGLCKGRFYLLGARPSMGKSALAQQIAETVAQTKNVLFFSLEMGIEEYTQRSIYRRSGYNQEHLTRGIIPREKIINAFAEASVGLEQLHLQIVDDPKCTLETIERNIQEAKTQLGSCDLVVVDYIQLMKSSDRRVIKDYDVVTDNSQGLKQLARKYDVPILGLCQLSRALEARQDKRPILADLRDSGSLEQDADCVMFVHRPEVFEPTNASLRGIAELIIAKNRQGARGRVIPLIFNGSKVEFKEVPKQ